MQMLKSDGGHVTHLLSAGIFDDVAPVPLCFSTAAQWEVVEIACPPTLPGFQAPENPEHWPGIRMCKRCIKRRTI